MGRTEGAAPPLIPSQESVRKKLTLENVQSKEDKKKKEKKSKERKEEKKSEGFVPSPFHLSLSFQRRGDTLDASA